MGLFSPRTVCHATTVTILAACVGTALGGQLNGQDDAANAVTRLQTMGATLKADDRRPGKPIVSVDL